MDELEALEFIRKSFNAIDDSSVILGIGDDSAAVKPAKNKLIITSVDTVVENRHFLLKKISPAILGRKAVAVSLSDITAMGGTPKYILSTIGFRKGISDNYFKELVGGIGQACSEFNVSIIGGNLTGSDTVFVDITAIGEVEKKNLITRSGAGNNEDIYVTGTVGDSSLGFQLLKSDIDSDILIKKHLEPQPRLSIGRELAQKGLVSSMIDISDGLHLDLSRITSDFGLGANIELDNLPLSDEYILNYKVVTEKKYQYAVSGGEDYELLFTAKEESESSIMDLSEDTDIRITKIGKVNESGLIKFIDENNFIQNFKTAGFSHFSNE